MSLSATHQEKLRANRDGVMQRIRAACERSGRAPDACRLLAVVKHQPDELVRHLGLLGQRAVAENRVQSLGERAADLRSQLDFELIGHLQTNKARRAREGFQAFHGLDSLRLAQQLSVHCEGRDEDWPVYLQINVAHEPQKYGCAPEELPALARAVRELGGLRIVGLMTMAPLGGDAESARPTFRALRELAEKLREHDDLPAEARELSMGMTQDFEVAVEEGATVVRVGSALFEGVLSAGQPVG